MTMKKVVNRNKAIVIAFATLVSMAFANTVNAAPGNGEPGVEIKYIGFLQSNPVFEIRINKPETENFVVTIRDRSGTVLFSEKLSGKTISRKYRIDTQEEIEEGGLRFEVKSVKNNKTEIYIAGMSENISREMAIDRIQ